MFKKAFANEGALLPNCGGRGMVTQGGMYERLAAAAVRGFAAREGRALPPALGSKPLEALTEQDVAALLDMGRAWGVKLYRFKRGHEDMPRVKQILGFLRAVQPESLLDVGSGRGVFLFPFLDAFPGMPVTSLDLLDHRVAFLEDIRRGGVDRLTALRADICAWPAPEKSVDVVTMLEVLEHIPDVQAAVTAAVRIARRYVAVTVPSKEDDNPEHIHLLTKQVLTELFQNAGCDRLHFGGVPGHLTLIAAIGEEA